MAYRMLAVLCAFFLCAPTMSAFPAYANETKTYTYDALGRLLTDTSSGTVNDGRTDTLTYDPAGNRTSFNSGGSGSSSVSISIDNPSITEGGVLAFSVTLSAPSTSSVTVNYATADGTAIAGTDYTATSGTLSIAAGQTSGTINVSTLDDNQTGESNEQMSVNLSKPSSGSTIAAGTGTGNIVEDNDTGWSSTLTAGSTNCGGYCGLMTGYEANFIGSMSNTSFNRFTVNAILGLSNTQIQFTLEGTRRRGQI